MEKFNYKKWILEHKEILSEKVKPGSEKQDKLPDGRTVTRYTAVSPKGKETPMISYDDELESPDDKKDLKPPIDKKPEDKEKTDGPKKYPFIGPKDKEFEVKMFDISPEAIKLYTELQNETFKDKPEILNILKSSAIHHESLFVIEKIALDDKSASKAQIKCAEDTVLSIKKFAREMGKENDHNYLQARIDSIKKIQQKNPREDKEGDCPDVKDIENNKDDYKKKYRVSKQSTTYGPSNPAPRYAEGMSPEEWADAKEKERLNKHPEKDKINKIKKMMDKEKSLKEKAIELGYLNESYNSITLHTDEGLYQEEKSNLEDLKSYPFPMGAEISVPALGSSKFANNIETREKTKDPNTQFGIDYYLEEFGREYGSTEFEVSKDLGNRYTLTPINNPKFDSAYETDRQKQIDRREKGPGWQRSDNMGNKTSKWS